MKNIRATFLITLFITIISAILTYGMQLYRMTELEECYIFLYDCQYVLSALKAPGGLAMLIGSALTQFMAVPWCGPVIAGCVYGVITLALCAIASRLKANTAAKALSLLPSICLFLCLENNSYKFQGHIAVLIAVSALWLYMKVPPQKKTANYLITGITSTLAVYWAAGSAAAIFVAGTVIYALTADRRHSYLSIIFIGIYAIAGYMAYQLQFVPTLKRALTPTMYYEWDTTSYMMLYTWCVTAVYLVAVSLWHKRKQPSKKALRTPVIFAVIVGAEIFAGYRLYAMVHNANVYRTMQQRYYAKHGMWDEIINLDYGFARTPYTSYRILALAQKGTLMQELEATRPFIDYFMKNQTLVKKEDLEVLSDIYYACDFMAAARHFAFDTNIVTPGAFNPYETKKLAEINILTGDYAVAEKYLDQLSRTLFYRQWAEEQRKFLNNPETVAADPTLSKKLAVIPEHNDYMSPKGTLRDLRHIIAANPDQHVARQMLDAFILLTHYKDPEPVPNSDQPNPNE